MDAAVVQEASNVDLGVSKESAFFVRENGEIAHATTENSTNSCATIRLPTNVSGLAHTHLEGSNPSTTIARELPGPLDTDALRKGLVQYIITPTHAVRKIEVVKVGDTYQPKLTTLYAGDKYTRRRQIKNIGKWKRTWSDQKNYNAVSGNRR